MMNDPLAWRLVVERFDIEGILLAHTSSETAAILPSIAGGTGWRLVLNLIILMFLEAFH